MGYETRLHIGELGNTEWNKENGTKKNPIYLMEISQVDLCKCDSTFINDVAMSMRRGKYVYFYPDGNTKTIEDSYGDRLKAIPAKTILKHLKKANEVENYRRYSMAIALLEVVVETFHNPYVMTYGH